MVRKGNDKIGYWHEPPYTWEEEMEFYRRMSPKPGVPMTIYRGPKKAADKQGPTGEPSRKDNDGAP